MHNGWDEHLREHLFRQYLSWDQKICCRDKAKNGALKLGSYFSKMFFYLLQWKPIKSDEKFILFHVKSFFRSWNIYIFALTFWLNKKRLDKKAKVNLKNMTSQTWQRIITIQILPNISRSDGNQTMTFGLLIEYSMIFFEKSHKMRWRI